MKKYYIVGVLGLLFTLLLGGFLFKYTNNNSSDNFWKFNDKGSTVWSYLPNEFDQILYARYNDDVQNFANQISQGMIPVEQQEFFKIIDEFALYQYQTGGNEYLCIVFSKKSGVSDDEVASLNILSGEQEYDLIPQGNGIFLYGEPTSLEYLKNNDSGKIVDNPFFKEYIKDIQNGKGNMAYITDLKKEVSKQGQLGFNNYAEYLQYGVLIGLVDKDNYKGSFDILLDGPKTIFQDINFKPKFEKYFGDDSFILAEVGSLFELAGVTDEQVNAILKMAVAGSGTGYAGMMTEEDYKKIVNVFDGNIGLVVAPADNLLGFGIALIIDNTEIFDLLKKFSPYIKQSLEGLDFLSGGVNIVENPDSIDFNFNHYYMGTMAESKIQIKKQDDNVILSIFDPNLTPKSDNFDLTYNDKSVFYFYINAGSILNLMEKFSFSLGPQFSQAAAGLKYFQNKIIKGRIDLDPKKISFKFNLTSNE